MLAALLASGVAAAQDVPFDGDVDTSDEVIVVTGSRLQDVDPIVESPVGQEIDPVLPAPRLVGVASEVFALDTPIEELPAPTIGAEEATFFHSIPGDYAYYGDGTAFAVHTMLIDVGDDWQDHWPYFEAAVFLSKAGVPGADPQPGVTNDPGTGAAQVSSIVWAGGQLQSVVGFAQDGVMNLYQNAYETTLNPVDGHILVSHWIADPTLTPTFVVSWSEDPTSPESVGFVRVEGEAPGTRNPVQTAIGDEERSDIIRVYATKVASLAGGAVASTTTTSSATTTEAEPEPTTSAADPEPTVTSGEEVPVGAGPSGDNTTTGGSSVLLFVVGGFVVLILIGGGIWFFMTRRETPTGPPISGPGDAPETSPPEEGPVGPLMSDVDEVLGIGEALGYPLVDGWQQVPFAEVREQRLYFPAFGRSFPDPETSAFWIKDGSVRLGTKEAPPQDPGETASGPPPESGDTLLGGDPHANLMHQPSSPPAGSASSPESGDTMLGGDPHANLMHHPGPGDTAPPAAEDPTATDGASPGDGTTEPDGSEAPWWGSGAPPVGPRDEVPVASDPLLTPDNDPYGVLEGAVDVSVRPITVSLASSTLTGDEAERMRRLQDIVVGARGTGDIPAVAEHLWAFNEWHKETFGEPWFTWTNDEGDDTLIGATTVDRFLRSRKMCCYEFVHFCAYLASDQLGRPRLVDQGVVEGERPTWGTQARLFPPRYATPSGDAPRGEVITGVSSITGVNKAGYSHVVISLGDGQVVGLGYAGLEKEPLDGAFGMTYGDLEHGPYTYRAQNPAPAHPTAPTKHW